MERFDTYGQEYHLTFNKQPKYKTAFGGILSIFTAIIVILCVWVFGREIYEKKNPIVTNTIQIDAKRKNITFKIPFAFTIEQTYGSVIPNYDKYVRFTARYTNTSFTPPSNVTTFNYPLKMRKCNINDFPSNDIGDFMENSLSSAYCLEEKDFTIGGFWNNKYTELIKIDLNTCINTTDDQSCKSDEEIYQFLHPRDKQMVMYYQSIDLDTKDYIRPNSYFFGTTIFRIENDFCKYNEFHIQENILFTDRGFLTDDYFNQTNQVVDKINKDVYTGIIEDPCLIKTRIYSSENTVVNSRTYFKLQGLAGQLGGILNIIFILFRSVIIVTYDRSMKEAVIRSIYDINTNEVIDHIDGRVTTKVDIGSNKVPVTPPVNSFSFSRNDEKVLNLELSKIKIKKDELSKKNEVPIVIKAKSAIMKGRNETRDKLFFTLFNNFKLGFCRCLAGKRLRALNDYYEKLYLHLLNIQML